MTIIGTDSAFAIAPEVTKGTLPAIGYRHWRWMPALNMAFSPIQDQKALPQELAGVTLPRAIYKSGAWGVGSVDFFPRFSNSAHLHWLLWSLCTSMSFVKSGVDGTPVSHTYEKFTYYYGAGDNYGYAGAGKTSPLIELPSNTLLTTTVVDTHDVIVPSTAAIASGSASNRINRYLAAKRLLPPDEDGNYRGETLQDVRVAGLTLRASPDAPLRVQAAMVGRIPKFYPAWDTDHTNDAEYGVMDAETGGNLKNEWNPSYISLVNDIPGLPGDDVYLGCKGTIYLGDKTEVDLSFTDVAVTIMPILTSPEDERILFDYHPEGFSITGWAIGFTVVIKKGLYEKYDDIFFGGGQNWSPVPWTAGAPVRMLFETASDTLVTTDNTTVDVKEPSRIEVYARDVSWSMAPIAPEPGRIVAAAITGVVTAPTDGKLAWYIAQSTGRSPDLGEDGISDPNILESWPAA